MVGRGVCGNDAGMLRAGLGHDRPGARWSVHPDNPLSATSSGTFTARGRTAGAPDQETVSGACWSGTTVATNAIAPGVGANRDGLAAGDPPSDEPGPAQRSHPAAAAGHPAPKEGREGPQPSSSLRPPTGAAPARLAAWCIGRAPLPGIRSRTDRGLESAPDARPVSYLHLAIRSIPSYSKMFGFEACRVSNPRRQPPDRR
jgi:hypothetical protein